jgi:hypothetical protein
MLAYAFDHERRRDAVWASAEWMRDWGGSFRRGDHVQLNAAYGRWLQPQNTAEDLGFVLAAGVHGEIAGRDHREDGHPAAGGYRVLGLHLTPILIKGRTQLRAGALFPVARSGYEARTDFAAAWRAGIESFF